MIGDSISSSVVKRALDGVWERQRAISTNLANYDTPGFKAKVVTFEDARREEVMKIQDTAKTREEIRSHLPAIENTNIRVAEDRTISQRLDGNNVDMDGESIELAKAQLQYMYLTNSMTNMYARLKTALSSNN